MRPKARGLALHGSPPGYLEESNLAGVILYMMDGPNEMPAFPFPYWLPWTELAYLRADGISSCELMRILAAVIL
jgi:hypothetical protein